MNFVFSSYMLRFGIISYFIKHLPMSLWFRAIIFLIEKFWGVLQITESFARKSPSDQIDFSCGCCYFCDMGTWATCATKQKHTSGGIITVFSMFLISRLTRLCFLITTNNNERVYLKLSQLFWCLYLTTLRHT